MTELRAMARAACLVPAVACAACTTASSGAPAAGRPARGSAVITVGLAVSAVLLFRLATYGLPVAPGWVSLSLLQRWDYV